MSRRTPVDAIAPQTPLWIALPTYLALVAVLVGGTVLGAMSMFEPAVVPFVQQFASKH